MGNGMQWSNALFNNLFFEKIKSLDTQLFLIINGNHNAVFDEIMYRVSDTIFWFPFYVLIAFFLIKQYGRYSAIIFVGVIVLIILSDQVSSHLIKNAVQRLRPSHEPSLHGLIHLNRAGVGGTYGFVSSHAANASVLTSFLFFTLSNKLNWLKGVLLFWVILVSYSRIYNGVHYPGDVLGGIVIGFSLGCFIAYFTKKFYGNNKENEAQRSKSK